VEHFSEVFEETDVEAALAAGIFHREEVPIEAVKRHMREKGIETLSVHFKRPFPMWEGPLLFCADIAIRHVNFYKGELTVLTV